MTDEIWSNKHAESPLLFECRPENMNHFSASM